MKRSYGQMAAAALLAVVVLAGCSTASREPVPAGPREQEQPRYTEADVRFVQRMIPHHAQALVMTDLVPARSNREGIRLLAERIEVSQRDEIAMMQDWLADRGEEVPNPDTLYEHHDAGSHDALMSGMLTGEEMARLAGATGAEFDRLFLEYMIDHHQGALAMVEKLFGSPGAAQEPAIFHLASEISASQRMEIARMRAVLDQPPA